MVEPAEPEKAKPAGRPKATPRRSASKSLRKPTRAAAAAGVGSLVTALPLLTTVGKQVVAIQDLLQKIALPGVVIAVVFLYWAWREWRQRTLIAGALKQSSIAAVLRRVVETRNPADADGEPAPLTRFRRADIVDALDSRVGRLRNYAGVRFFQSGRSVEVTWYPPTRVQAWRWLSGNPSKSTLEQAADDLLKFANDKKWIADSSGPDFDDFFETSRR